MPEANPIQVGFNGGRLGAYMAGRVDLASYKTGCKTLKNFIPTMQGPALKRSGTRFVKHVKDQTKKSRLIPFEYSRTQAYVLEFADNAIRIMRDNGAVLESDVAISPGFPPTIANPCVITTTLAHGFTTGDEIYIDGSRLEFLNNQYFTVTVTAATTFTLTYDGAAVSSVGESLATAGANKVNRIVQVLDGIGGNAVPWTDTDLKDIQFVQSENVLYIVHPSYPPHKLTRVSDTSWTCAAVTFNWPPFRDENTSATTVYASAASGAAVTVTASTAIFTANMVGGYIKIGEVIETFHPTWITDSDMAIYFDGPGVGLNDQVIYGGKVYELTDKNGGSKTGTLAPVHEEGAEFDTLKTANNFEWTFVNRGFGYGQITAIGGGGTTATVDTTVGITMPNSVVGSGNATKKWAISAFCDEYGYPTAVAFYERRLWLAGTSTDPQTFWGSRTDKFENFERVLGLADSGVQWTIGENKVNQIQWMFGQEVLAIGTKGGEFGAFSNSPDSAITPDNIKVKRRSSFGSASSISPVPVDSSLMMVHRNARRIHELIYDINSEKYEGPDLTSMSDDILSNGATAMAYAAAPHRQLFVVDAVGGLKALTYVKNQEIFAWADYTIASYGGAYEGGVVESVCVIPHPDGDQDQVWVTVKRAESSTKRWIEYFEKPFASGSSQNDGFFVDGGSTYSGSAATSTYGLLYLAGKTVDALVDGVQTTLAVSSKGEITFTSATRVQIGFAISAELETMDLEIGDTNNAAQGKRGRVVEMVVRVNTLGQGLQYGQSLGGTLDTYTQTGVNFTGDTPMLTVPGGFSRSRVVALQHRTLLPCTIISIMPKLAVEVG